MTSALVRSPEDRSTLAGGIEQRKPARHTDTEVSGATLGACQGVVVCYCRSPTEREWLPAPTLVE